MEMSISSPTLAWLTLCTLSLVQIREDVRGKWRERKRGFKASNEPGASDQLPAVFPTTLSCPIPPPHLTYTILIIVRIPTFLSFSIIFMREILAGQLPTPKQSIEGRCKAGAKEVLLYS